MSVDTDAQAMYGECTFCNGFGEHVMVDGLNDKSVCTECEGSGMAVKKKKIVKKIVKKKKVARVPVPEVFTADEGIVVIESEGEVPSDVPLIIADDLEYNRPLDRIVGRAPAANRSRKLLIRMSQAEYTDLGDKAEAQGMSMAHYLRAKAELNRK